MERFVLLKKIVGLVQLALLFVPPILARQPGKPPLFLIIFLPPFIFFTIPYMLASFYLLLSKKKRKLDIALILIVFVLSYPSMTLNLPTPGYLLVYLTTQARSDSLAANGTLQVVILDAEGRPIVGLEVDLWTIEALPGPPDVDFVITDENGVATFVVPSGKYKVGFNLVNFPEQFTCPPWTPVTVKAGETTVKVIELNYKGG